MKAGVLTRHLAIPGLALLVIAGLSGCGAAATPTPLPPTSTPLPPTAPPTATPVPPTATPALEPAAEGKAIFAQQGCAACHGEEAEGTDIAPSLPGHSRDAVIRAVRNPRGTMPSYDPDQLSDAELEQIVAFIASLGPVREAPALEASVVESAHLQMALAAVEMDDAGDATHHIQDLLRVAGEEAREAGEAILVLLQAGELHDAEHEIEELVEPAPSAEALAKLHLQASLTAVQSDDTADARHHLQHFVDAAAPNEQATAQAALEWLEKGDLHEAAHEIEELLAVE